MIFKKITAFAVMAVLCLGFTAFGQTNKAVDLATAGIQVGQRVPGEFWERQQVFYEDGRLGGGNFADLKGRPMVIDFWASWCGVCVGELARVDSLQGVLAGRLDFVRVSYQSGRELVPFLKGRYPGGVPLRHVLGDKFLKGLFPYREVPHYVWIAADGVVAAMTGPAGLTSENLAVFVAGGVPDVEQKREVVVAFDRKLPLSQYPGFASKLDRQSSFTPFLEGISGGYSQSVRKVGVQGPRKISVYNGSIPYLFAVAHGKGATLLNRNRWVLEVADTAKLVSAAKGAAFRDWQMENSFCYELMVDSAAGDRAWGMMLSDLSGYFGSYEVVMEKRSVRCWALVRTADFGGLMTRGGEPVFNVVGRSATLQNFALGHLVDRLNFLHHQYSPYPLVDATGITGNVDLVINAKLADMSELNAALSAYGLTFREQLQELPMLVIRDRREASK